MIVTYKTLDRINFPVFILPSSNWDLTDGLLYLDGELVDDKNMPGKTLGQRRLQTPHKGLIPLRKSLDSLVGILKQPNYYFIDSKGVPFIYQKTLMLPLEYRKIRKFEKKTINFRYPYGRIDIFGLTPLPFLHTIKKIRKKTIIVAKIG